MQLFAGRITKAVPRDLSSEMIPVRSCSFCVFPLGMQTRGGCGLIRRLEKRVERLRRPFAQSCWTKQEKVSCTPFWVHPSFRLRPPVWLLITPFTSLGYFQTPVWCYGGFFPLLLVRCVCTDHVTLLSPSHLPRLCLIVFTRFHLCLIVAPHPLVPFRFSTLCVQIPASFSVCLDF